MTPAEVEQLTARLTYLARRITPVDQPALDALASMARCMGYALDYSSVRTMSDAFSMCAAMAAFASEVSREAAE